MKLKYIRVEVRGCETLILFQEFVQHIEMAKKFGGATNVLSAGFCSIQDEKASCYGKSESLKKEADPTDTRMLQRMLKDY